MICNPRPSRPSRPSRRTTAAPLVAAAVALVLVAGACGGDAEPADDASGIEASSDSTATHEATTDASGDTATTDGGSANTAEVVAAAEALIATLSDAEVDTLMYDFGDTSITSLWSNLPACSEGGNAVERAGIRHGDLTDEQLAATLALAEAVLSDDGYAEYTDIIVADDYLQDTFGNTIWDSDCYYMAIYGAPSETDSFAVQFGGHHYARMVTYTGTSATITPAFTGVEPSSFVVDGTTYAPLDDEMASVYGIFDDLDDDQLAAAELDATFDDVLLGPGSDDAFPATEGLAVAELSDDQQAEVLDAIRAWVDDVDPSVADAAMTTIEAELADTYIAWSTATDLETENGYARIDGPSVWIEVANQSGLSGVHYHTIHRDKTDDYGDAA